MEILRQSTCVYISFRCNVFLLFPASHAIIHATGTTYLSIVKLRNAQLFVKDSSQIQGELSPIPTSEQYNDDGDRVQRMSQEQKIARLHFLSECKTSILSPFFIIIDLFELACWLDREARSLNRITYTSTGGPTGLAQVRRIRRTSTPNLTCIYMTA